MASEAKGRGFDPRSAYHLFLFLPLLILFAPPPLAALDLYIKDARRLADSFLLLDYRLDETLIPPLFNAYMPDGMTELGDRERVDLFVRTVLPLILRENRHILADRERLEKIAAAPTLSADEERFLRSAAWRYRAVEGPERAAPLTVVLRTRIQNDLLFKVRPIDPAVALGIAALESGWGTSRFSREANNIFGQTAYYAWRGLKPLRWKGQGRQIKKFDTISDSMAGFMLNLNRNRAYRRYRILRDRAPHDPLRQADGFLHYSELGAEYVARLRGVMKRFRLLRHSAATLDTDERIREMLHHPTPYLQ